MASSRSRHAIAVRVWKRLFDFIIATAHERNAVLGRHGLTPNDSRALFSLTESHTMGSLADAWKCDASYATLLVDRLEQKGLAERHARAGDRRVKLVRLTAKGRRTKAAIARALYKPPRALLDLELTELEALDRTTDALSAYSTRL